MNQWDSYIPPLNLWNYNLYYKWFDDLDDENLFDGDDLDSTGQRVTEQTAQ